MYACWKEGQGYADDLLKNMSFKLDTYAIDKELQLTDDYIFCVVPFTLCLVFPTIS